MRFAFSWSKQIDATGWPHFYMKSWSSMNVPVFPWHSHIFIMLKQRQWIPNIFLIQWFKTMFENVRNSVGLSVFSVLFTVQPHMLKRFSHTSTNLNYYFYCTDNNYGYYYSSHEFYVSFHFSWRGAPSFSAQSCTHWTYKF